MRVAILGSCVTRDAFEFDTAGKWCVRPYVARTALGSLFGPRTSDQYLEYHRLPSKFQQRVVRDDIEKNGLTRILSNDFDFIIYDAIDDRYPLALFHDEGIATESLEFRGLGVPADLYTTIDPWTAAHYERWESGWRALMEIVTSLRLRNRVLIHGARWALQTRASMILPGDPLMIAKANEWLERAEERMAHDVQGSQFIRVPHEHHVADPSHRWGLAPFHYIPSYYEEFLRRLDMVSAGQFPTPARSADSGAARPVVPSPGTASFSSAVIHPQPLIDLADQIAQEASLLGATRVAFPTEEGFIFCDPVPWAIVTMMSSHRLSRYKLQVRGGQGNWVNLSRYKSID